MVCFENYCHSKQLFKKIKNKNKARYAIFGARKHAPQKSLARYPKTKKINSFHICFSKNPFQGGAGPRDGTHLRAGERAQATGQVRGQRVFVVPGAPRGNHAGDHGVRELSHFPAVFGWRAQRDRRATTVPNDPGRPAPAG